MYVGIDLLTDEIAFRDRVGIEIFEKGYGFGNLNPAIQELMGMVKGPARLWLAKILIHNPVYDIRPAKGFHINDLAAVKSKGLDYISVSPEKIFARCGKIGYQITQGAFLACIFGSDFTVCCHLDDASQDRAFNTTFYPIILFTAR